MEWVRQLFAVNKPAIGMIHLLSLPGAPGHDLAGGMAKIVQAARQDLLALQDGGIDAVMFCNEHDRPYTLQADAAASAATACVIGELHASIRIPYEVVSCGTRAPRWRSHGLAADSSSGRSLAVSTAVTWGFGTRMREA